MTLEAAFRSAAHAEPSRIVSIRSSVSRRAGSGLLLLPNAVIAPEITPSVGGSRVNGRVKSTYRRIHPEGPGVAAVATIPSDIRFNSGPSSPSSLSQGAWPTSAPTAGPFVRVGHRSIGLRRERPASG